jgi:periplasmic divalent cation tolerance protein
MTAGDADEAGRIVDRLLGDRLVACVNQVPSVESDYWWQGRREKAGEVLLLAKTRRALWERVLAALREVHSYEVFEAIAVPVLESNPDYHSWIIESTAGD